MSTSRITSGYLRRFASEGSNELAAPAAFMAVGGAGGVDTARFRAADFPMKCPYRIQASDTNGRPVKQCTAWLSSSAALEAHRVTVHADDGSDAAAAPAQKPASGASPSRGVGKAVLGAARRVWCVVGHGERVLRWFTSDEADAALAGELDLATVDSLLGGAAVDEVGRGAEVMNDRDLQLCFTLRTATRRVVMQAGSVDDFVSWVDALASLVPQAALPVQPMALSPAEVEPLSLSQQLLAVELADALNVRAAGFVDRLIDEGVSVADIVVSTGLSAIGNAAAAGDARQLDRLLKTLPADSLLRSPALAPPQLSRSSLPAGVAQPPGLPMPPVLAAAAAGRPACLELLLLEGADAMAAASVRRRGRVLHGVTALHLASEHGEGCIAGLGAPWSGRSAPGRIQDDSSSDESAADEGVRQRTVHPRQDGPDWLSCCSLLCDLAWELVNTADSRGNTPLHSAARSGTEPIVRILVESAANLYWRNSAAETPAAVAVRTQNERVAVTLLTLTKGDGADFAALERRKSYRSRVSRRDAAVRSASPPAPPVEAIALAAPMSPPPAGGRHFDSHDAGSDERPVISVDEPEDAVDLQGSTDLAAAAASASTAGNEASPGAAADWMSGSASASASAGASCGTLSPQDLAADGLATKWRDGFAAHLDSVAADSAVGNVVAADEAGDGAAPSGSGASSPRPATAVAAPPTYDAGASPLSSPVAPSSPDASISGPSSPLQSPQAASGAAGGPRARMPHPRQLQNLSVAVSPLNALDRQQRTSKYIQERQRERDRRRRERRARNRRERRSAAGPESPGTDVTGIMSPRT